jgi:hypothetical protein
MKRIEYSRKTVAPYFFREITKDVVETGRRSGTFLVPERRPGTSFNCGNIKCNIKLKQILLFLMLSLKRIVYF